MKYAYFYLPFPRVKKLEKCQIDKLGCSGYSGNYFHFVLYLEGAEILHRKGNIKNERLPMEWEKIFTKHMTNIQNIQGIHTTEKMTQLKNEQRT